MKVVRSCEGGLMVMDDCQKMSKMSKSGKTEKSAIPWWPVEVGKCWGVVWKKGWTIHVNDVNAFKMTKKKKFETGGMGMGMGSVWVPYGVCNVDMCCVGCVLLRCRCPSCLRIGRLRLDI